MSSLPPPPGLPAPQLHTPPSSQGAHNNNGPQSSASSAPANDKPAAQPKRSPWYASIPLPHVSHPSLSAYTFNSKDLEQQVFTHSSAATPIISSSSSSSSQSQSSGGAGQSSTEPKIKKEDETGVGGAGSNSSSWLQSQSSNAAAAEQGEDIDHQHQHHGQQVQADNSTLQWAGASVVQSLCSIILTSLFPGLSSQALSDLRNALTSKPLHTSLSRALSLPSQFRHAPATTLPSDRLLADLFEAYIGGIARELGTENFGKLYTWYYHLLEPYVSYYHNAYLSRGSPNGPPSQAPIVSSTESKLRRQNVAAYTSRLMEYAAKSRLEPPKFEFRDNGLQGAGIQWEAVVSLGGQEVARAKATTKLEAKHLASREALGTLRDPAAMDVSMGITGGGVERRKRKMERRMRGGGGGGVGGGVAGGFGHTGGFRPSLPVPIQQQQMPTMGMNTWAPPVVPGVAAPMMQPPIQRPQQQQGMGFGHPGFGHAGFGGYGQVQQPVVQQQQQQQQMLGGYGQPGMMGRPGGLFGMPGQ